MQSIPTVVTPAESQDLTVIATVRAVAGITEVQVDDVNMATLIRQASGICAEYLGRSFGLQTVSETFFFDWRGASLDGLPLTHRPVASVTSVTVDGVVADPTEYLVNAASGRLLRLSSGAPTPWCASQSIVVVYEAGYLLLDDLPQGIERACIELIRIWWTSGSTGGRDTSVRRESVEIPGVRTIQQEFFASGGFSGSSGSGLPLEVTNLLDPHREVFV